LERSCNVYFETMADRLGMEGVNFWMDQFGLGRPTGIWISERGGSIPRDARGLALRLRSTVWFAGIGQGQVQATPLQMANVVATIARDGHWLRPHLITNDRQLLPHPTTNPVLNAIPDSADLHLSPAALRAVKQGMINVVQGPAGTGTDAFRKDLLIAGKTGTAQAAPFRLLQRDATGKPLLDSKGNRVYNTV